MRRVEQGGRAARRRLIEWLPNLVPRQAVAAPHDRPARLLPLLLLRPKPVAVAVLRLLRQKPNDRRRRRAATPPRRTLSWPPTSHTVKLMFLYSTVSTLKPARATGMQEPMSQRNAARAAPRPFRAAGRDWWSSAPRRPGPDL